MSTLSVDTIQGQTTAANVKMPAGSTLQVVSAVKTDTTVINSATNLVGTRHYFVDTTASSVTVTFPASPSLGDTIYVSDAYGTWDTNNCIVNPNSEKINGVAGNSTLSSEYDSKEYIYIGGTAGWRTV